MMKFSVPIFFCFFFATGWIFGQQQFQGSGTIRFTSKAPLETIQATSDELLGILDFQAQTFAFSFQVKTFNGFNSPLQKEHFNEYYLETKKYPKSTFTGKIIGLENCSDGCDLTTYAKGKLTIHGITKVVTIPLSFKKSEDSIAIDATFTVLLADYGISIPKILESKISQQIEVAVQSTLTLPND